LKSCKVKGVRFDALKKICEIFDCRPGDILEYRPEEEAKRGLIVPSPRSRGG